MNRMQLQPELSMAEFLNRYGSEAALVATCWPEGFVCPACGGRDHGGFVRAGRRHWQCAA